MFKLIILYHSNLSNLYHVGRGIRKKEHEVVKIMTRSVVSPTSPPRRKHGKDLEKGKKTPQQY